MAPFSQALERYYELLAGQAVGELTPEETAELQELARRYPEIDDEALEQTAGAIFAAGVTEYESLPASLRDKLMEEARKQAPEKVVVMPRRGSGARNPGMWSGWIAAAAVTILAVFGLMQTRKGEPTPAEGLQRLRATANDIQSVPWSATQDPAAAGLTGEVVWSPSQQTGYVRIRNMAANNPRLSVYQLWIFDSKRDSAYPVDGGMFNVEKAQATQNEVIVPIRPRLPVYDAALFAVTVEQPGGAVVSKRERIVALAKRG